MPIRRSRFAMRTAFCSEISSAVGSATWSVVGAVMIEKRLLVGSSQLTVRPGAPRSAERDAPVVDEAGGSDPRRNEYERRARVSGSHREEGLRIHDREIVQ